MSDIRIGIDFGGSKIEIAALSSTDEIILRRRVATPATYDAAIAAVRGLVQAAEDTLGLQGSIGIGIPGRLDPVTGTVHNANCLDGRAVQRDLDAALERPVRIANDAVCFALSEAKDGAGRGAPVVFGAILGTGCGGGVVVDGAVLRGLHGVAGEWGHSPFPWEQGDAIPGRRCWCGQIDCVETVISGRALAIACDGPGATNAASVAWRAANGDGHARATLDRHAVRLAQALSWIVNLLDPDAIVLGGGLSKMDHLYDSVPRLLSHRVFGGVTTPILRPVHGDSSGVRGAAWLWPSGRGQPSLAA